MLSQLIVNIRYGIFVVLKNKMGPQEVFFFFHYLIVVVLKIIDLRK